VSKTEKVAAGIAVVLIAAVLIGVGLALGTLILWFFGNIVLEAFGQERISVWVAFALAVLLWFIGSLFKSNNSK
jgi:Flp pilus assembly pilin Flp